MYREIGEREREREREREETETETERERRGKKKKGKRRRKRRRRRRELKETKGVKGPQDKTPAFEKLYLLVEHVTGLIRGLW